MNDIKLAKCPMCGGTNISVYYDALNEYFVDVKGKVFQVETHEFSCGGPENIACNDCDRNLIASELVKANKGMNGRYIK